jgi:ABC-type molybdate transport system substrate-binding protein
MRATGHYIEIPASYHPPIEQAAVVLRSSRQPDVARQFLSFLQKPESQRALQEAGFVLPARSR